MKKFLLHLFMIAAALTGAVYLFLYWTGIFSPAPLVACIYTDDAPLHIELETMGIMFENEGYTFESTALTDDLTLTATTYIEAGAAVLIFDLNEVQPDSSLFDIASEYGTVLFFTGTSPDTSLLENYDKAWYLGASAEYAGELLGTEIALGFREGEIVDANSDLLLDYFLSDTNSTNAVAYLETALLECDHYGVYTVNIMDTAALLGLTTSTNESEETAVEETSETEETTTADGEEAAESSEANLSSEAVSIELQILPTPEVVMSLGESNAQIAYAFAQKQGWLAGETAPQFTAIVESYAIAKALCAEYDNFAIVYYDTVYTTDALIQMTSNVINNRYLTLGTDFIPESDSSFLIPYQIYS